MLVDGATRRWRVAVLAATIVCVAAVFPSSAIAIPARRPAHAPAAISIARVDVLLRRDLALVTTDVTMTRGSLDNAEGFDVYVAYGSPGLPRALDAQLIPVADGAFTTPLDTPGVALSLDHVVTAPGSVTFSLGRTTQAGAVVHVPSADLVRALAPSGLGTLRVRAIHALSSAPEASIVARVASPLLGPFPLGVLSVRGDGIDVTEASATLCSTSGSSTELTLSTGPRRSGTMAPPLARHGTDDDLCFRAMLKKSHDPPARP
jgi:hypothetical protein